MNYYRGICLRGNAKAKNCHVERFLQGFHVSNSGEIKESLASQNRVGIRVSDDPGPRFQKRELLLYDSFDVTNVHRHGFMCANLHSLLFAFCTNSFLAGL